MTIRRSKGRIAGYSKPPCPVHVLWAGTNRPRKKTGKRKDGFSFPPAVRELLLQKIQGFTALHFFGGKANFGYRLDIDPVTKPHVLGNAWEAEKYFTRDQFDDVILDPPFQQWRMQEKRAVLIRAAWIAKRFVWWHGTVWLCADRGLKCSEAWLIRTDNNSAIRVLQKFAVGPNKKEPREDDLQRGEGLKLKYQKWDIDSSIPLFQDVGQFAPAPLRCDCPWNGEGVQIHNANCINNLLAGQQNRNRVFLGDWE